MTVKIINRTFTEGIVKELTIKERITYFHLIQTYNTIIDKLNNHENLTNEEDLFLLSRPHSINDFLEVDLIERSVILIDYRKL